MMKTLFKFVTACAVLFLTFSLQAQTSFGVRAGINLANVGGDTDGEGTDIKIGLMIGGIANIPVNENFSIQPEIHFIQKGYSQEDSFLGETFSVKLKLNYLELPIHAKYKINGDRISGFFLAGPAIGYALNGNAEFCSGGECEEVDLEIGEEESGFNRLDLGLSIGGGISLNNGLFLDLRYVLGISNLADDDVDDTKIKNRGFNIGVGYMFGGDSNNR